MCNTDNIKGVLMTGQYIALKITEEITQQLCLAL